MDRLDELALLVAVVDSGSLAAAARRLRRSPPAVTRGLAALEDRIGRRLVERTTRRLAPTEAGRQLAEEARRLIGDYEAALQQAADAPLRGLLRVTAPLVFGTRHVAPLLVSFLDRHPEITVDLVLNDRNLDMIEEGIHAAIRIGPLSDSALVVRKVGSVRRMLVASPDYLARRGTPERPGDLQAHDTIVAVGAGDVTEWRFAGAAHAVRLAPRLRVSAIEAALVAVRAGRGIARVLSYQVADELAAGTLVRILQPFEPSPLPVQLAFPSGKHLAPKVRAFLDHAAAGLERLPVIREA